MLIFYYRCPKGRVYRRQKKYRYLSQPNFQAFSEIFSPEFKLDTSSTSGGEDKKDKKESAKKSNEKVSAEEGKVGYRFTINDKKENENKEKEDNKNKESLPLYYADDLKVGEIGEKIKYMFPNFSNF